MFADGSHPRAHPNQQHNTPTHLTADGDPKVTTSASNACCSSRGSELLTPTVSYVLMQFTLGREGVTAVVGRGGQRLGGGMC